VTTQSDNLPNNPPDTLADTLENKPSTRTLQENVIDWNEMAEVFDRWLPYIQPLAEALIDLADISEGDAVLDVASGTGEPSLTLARRFRNRKIDVVGVDGAAAMVERANQKAQAEGLSALRFEEMKAEALSFESNRFDRVISRFGVMLFDDPLLGVEAMRRVLKPKGKMAIAVWGEFRRISSLYLVWDVLMKSLPEEARPPLPRIGSLGPPGKLEALLKSAGFEAIEIKPYVLTYRFDDFESYWSVGTSAGLLKDALDRLSPSQRQSIKNKVEGLMAPYRKNGGLAFENEAILALASK